jgi:EAL domain-containing protein (putative c-di-GMP-specific phosphodiesterase class I)
MSMSYVHTEIVQLIVHLAKSIGMSVSAEGVEDRDQAEALSHLGCNIAQGYLYSPPLPMDSLTATLMRPSHEPSPRSLKAVRSVRPACRTALAR